MWVALSSQLHSPRYLLDDQANLDLVCKEFAGFENHSLLINIKASKGIIQLKFF